MITSIEQWLENCAILDAETTGLGSDAEACELSLIDGSGATLMDTLIKPSKPIPNDAIRIHGITNEMAADAPTWAEIHAQFIEIIQGRTLIIYNAAYDTRVLNQTAKIAGCGDFDIQFKNAKCAMLLYAEFWGDWNDHRGNYKWQKLTDAAEQQGVVVEGKAHRALADCKMTLGVLKAMTK